MESYIQVTTTTEHKEDAEKIARTLVDGKLAGCVQIIGPITSIYRWENQVEETQEWQCVIKSRQNLYGEIEKAIRFIHPYEVPEIIAVSIMGGSQDYLEWLHGVLIDKQG
jgi:periplasmic divalent cation tolerance protein